MSIHVYDTLIVGQSIDEYRLKNGSETDIYVLAYNTTDQFRPASITENAQTSTLLWNGPRLKQYGSYQYTYNESGLRIKKTGTNLNVKYDLDGLMIIRTTDVINNEFINYHFDQHEQVIG